VNPSLYVGGFFQYGFAFVNKDNRQECSQGASCSSHDIALGVNVHYHILPAAPFDPWIGAGLGYEVGTLNESGTLPILGPIDDSLNYKGFQFLILEAGGDFMATPNFAVGPFLNFALGQFSTYSESSTNSNGTTVEKDGDLTDTGLHEWLTIGVRGQFNL
jgi:outer membrane protein W